VSVSLPTWKANVGYEEGEEWVVSQMKIGYPRFFVHESIQKLAGDILQRFGDSTEQAATLFPSRTTATICRRFISSRVPSEEAGRIRVLHFAMSPRLYTGHQNADQMFDVTSRLSCVLYPKAYAKIAQQVWQHSGSGISSRRSEFCRKALEDGYLVEESRIEADDFKAQRLCKGPKRYQKNGSLDSISRANATIGPGNSEGRSENTRPEGREYAQFIEERFGRNLSTAFAENAKTAVRRRIAGSLTADVELNEALETGASDSRISGLTEDDVFLFPTGMNSIFNTHQALLDSRGEMKSICFGFPYIDTLKILEKWGPGCLFYGNGSSSDLDDLERRLSSGEKYLALFTEFPGNPLLKSPDLERIHDLAVKYDFVVIVDESVGNFINVNVLPSADIVVSSLTKIFSGDSNVMGGSAVLNPHGRYYQLLKHTLSEKYEDNYWVEDAVFLERNSRNFVSRIARINSSTEAVTDLLKASPLGKLYIRFSLTIAYSFQ
jgi:cystathionine gamma-synthase